MRGGARRRAEAEDRMRECDGHRAEHAARAEQLIQLHSPPGRIDRCGAGPTDAVAARGALRALCGGTACRPINRCGAVALCGIRRQGTHFPLTEDCINQCAPVTLYHTQHSWVGRCKTAQGIFHGT